MVEVFIVLPDLADSKINAICRLEEPVNVLVSYATFLMKPSNTSRIERLRKCVEGKIMLDSGAYHFARKSLYVDVKAYAKFAKRYDGVFDFVVASDVPGDWQGTLERTLRFAELYEGDFIPVLQHIHLKMFWVFLEAGIVARAPRANGSYLLGVGGLDGERRRVNYVADVVFALRRNARYLGFPVKLHVFGAGARLLRSLAKRGLLDVVYSVDTGAWQAEIRYRRRSELGADGVGEAELNAIAIKRYMERARRAIER